MTFRNDKRNKLNTTDRLLVIGCIGKGRKKTKTKKLVRQRQGKGKPPVC